MNQMQYLTEIVKKDDNFYFRFEIPEEITFQFVLPVYTNAHSMTDKIGVSQNLKALAKGTYKKTNEVIQDVDKDTAQMIFNIAKNSDMIESFETLEFQNTTVIRIK